MAMGQMQKTIKLNVGTSEDLWPYQVVDEIQRVMEKELKAHPDGGWEKLPIMEHLKYAEEHLRIYRKKLTATNPMYGGIEDHLAHAFCRLMMAVAIKHGYGQTEFDAMVAERDKKRGR